MGMHGGVVPRTCENFMKLCAGTERASNGTKLAYEGSPFHRIIPNFMIQVSYRLGSFCFVAVKNTFYSR